MWTRIHNPTCPVKTFTGHKLDLFLFELVFTYSCFLFLFAPFHFLPRFLNIKISQPPQHKITTTGIYVTNHQNNPQKFSACPRSTQNPNPNSTYRVQFSFSTTLQSHKSEFPATIKTQNHKLKRTFESKTKVEKSKPNDREIGVENRT